MARAIGPVSTALAMAALVSATVAAQAPGLPLTAPSVQFAPPAPFPPPPRPQPQPGRPLFSPPTVTLRSVPALTPRTPPPVTCTMRVIPVDPTTDPKIVKEPDANVNYAKHAVPPPACR